MRGGGCSSEGGGVLSLSSSMLCRLSANTEATTTLRPPPTRPHTQQIRQQPGVPTTSLIVQLQTQCCLQLPLPPPPNKSLSP